MTVADAAETTRRALLEFALGLPGAWEDHPWGETVAKVGKKIFLFAGQDKEGRLAFSLKLPESGDAALAMPLAAPTGYGLGDSGWVTLRVGKKDKAPVGLYLSWVEESYRAVAPKKLVKALDGGGAEAAPVAKRRRVRPAGSKSRK